MATEAFPPIGHPSTTYGYSGSNSLASVSPSNLFSMPPNRSPTGSSSPGGESSFKVHIRKLPPKTGNETVQSMLLFAEDLISAEMVQSVDEGFSAAVAHFKTLAGAQKAQTMLNGKPNATREANMIVEVTDSGILGPQGATKRSGFDQRDTNSSDASANPTRPRPTRQSSRFGETFQALDRKSPPRAVSDLETSKPEGQAPSYANYFSPQSPIGQPIERQRVSGKSVIGEDGVDDETGKIINDPVAYAQNGLGKSMAAQSDNQPRRPTLPQLPLDGFSALNINNTGMTSPTAPGMVSPRSGTMQSPSAYSPPGVNNMRPNASYQFSNPHYLRSSYPPINPADQNPPCNTLYVGNLPQGTSEDELKAVFCKQRGYKRLCFRTKQNGPMCFVEFEDISHATKALNECYGLMLHNSTKGGIRLSFSKNPLGVRSGQPGSLGSPISPQGQMNGMNGFAGMSFSNVNGPPPGLAAPPGLSPVTTANLIPPLGSMGSPTNATVGAAAAAAGFPGALSTAGNPLGVVTGMRSPTGLGGAGGGGAAGGGPATNGWPTQNGGNQQQQQSGYFSPR